MTDRTLSISAAVREAQLQRLEASLATKTAAKPSSTAEQLKNIGGAQEDSDCMLAPEWQRLYETRAVQMIRRLLR